MRKPKYRVGQPVIVQYHGYDVEMEIVSVEERHFLFFGWYRYGVAGYVDLPVGWTLGRAQASHFQYVHEIFIQPTATPKGKKE